MANVVNVTRNISQSTANTPAVTLLAGDTLNLAQNAGLFSIGTGSSADGVVAAGGNTMNILGVVYSSQGDGIESTAGNNTISIGATGAVFGYWSAISFAVGGNTITNAGQLNAGANGSGIHILGTGNNVITNSGYIRSGFLSGVEVNGTGNTFNNSGIIEAYELHYALVISGAVVNTGTLQAGSGVALGSAAGSSLINSGSIIAFNVGGVAVFCDVGADTVRNTGLIQTAGPIAVNLWSGNDTYDGRGGRVVGAVLGNEGADTLTGGAFVDRLEGGSENDQINGGVGGDYIDGGAGFDLARYDFATTGVQARLDNAALNTGEAAGDTMYNFEGLVGSQHGDILVGNDLAIGNQIHGLGGNDTIRGLAGADILYGNAGSDSIFTGAGTDTVWVQAADRIATQLDRVFDFTDGQDHLRFQGISAASATITDSQGGTLIQFNVAGGQFSVFLDGITKAASADQIFFV